MNDILTQYFAAFAAKDLSTLATLYDDDVVLWEWGTNVMMGKADVLAANRQLFDSVTTLRVMVHGHAPFDDTGKSCTELSLFLDQHMISVVDVIQVVDGKIRSVSAYRGF
jgi:ketosteroid isomerase-like protein